jgi:hypothetical protein
MFNTFSGSWPWRGAKLDSIYMYEIVTEPLAEYFSIDFCGILVNSTYFMLIECSFIITLVFINTYSLHTFAYN